MYAALFTRVNRCDGVACVCARALNNESKGGMPGRIIGAPGICRIEKNPLGTLGVRAGLPPSLSRLHYRASSRGVPNYKKNSVRSGIFFLGG